MCGRFTMTASAQAVKALFRLFDLAHLEQRYNVAPTTQVPAVIPSHSNSESQNAWPSGTSTNATNTTAAGSR